MKTQIVVLKVTWDEADDIMGMLRMPPDQWKWTELIEDQCEVLAAGPVTEVDEP